MNGLEILDRVAYGKTLFHRDKDAWDLLDSNGLVVAVLCPRQRFLAVSPPAGGRVTPKRAGARIPYGEKVEFRIDETNLEDGIACLNALL